MLKDCRDLQIRHQTDPSALPFEDGSVDVVTAVCVYHHLPPAEQRAVTREAWRGLTAGKVRRIMRAAGLTPVKTTNYLFLPERLFGVMGRLEDWLATVPAGGQFAVFGTRAPR